ncbi:flagellar hook-length control protein FliK [Thioalkalicoccus limnaeus]|uniref:Flagellar hook-length control protein FliK n=1 Tax=Thioalkalicoccus limnaeus TaxID=120681 RepID=A0ABV4BBQ5_9GAMM
MMNAMLVALAERFAPQEKAHADRSAASEQGQGPFADLMRQQGAEESLPPGDGGTEGSASYSEEPGHSAKPDLRALAHALGPRHDSLSHGGEPSFMGDQTLTLNGGREPSVVHPASLAGPMPMDTPEVDRPSFSEQRYAVFLRQTSLDADRGDLEGRAERERRVTDGRTEAEHEVAEACAELERKVVDGRAEAERQVSTGRAEAVRFGERVARAERPEADPAGARPSDRVTMANAAEDAMGGRGQVATNVPETEGAAALRMADVSSSMLQAGRVAAQVGIETGRPEGLAMTGMASLDVPSRPLTTGPTPAPLSALTQPVAAQGWGDEFGTRLKWLVGRRETIAELRLNPPELGRLEIHIKQEKAKTSVSVIVQSAQVREAVVEALPRLREMFNEAGLSLESLDVTERQAEGRADGERERAPSDESMPEGRDHGQRPASRSLTPTDGLIDTFA